MKSHDLASEEEIHQMDEADLLQYKEYLTDEFDDLDDTHSCRRKALRQQSRLVNQEFIRRYPTKVSLSFSSELKFYCLLIVIVLCGILYLQF